MAPGASPLTPKSGIIIPRFHHLPFHFHFCPTGACQVCGFLIGNHGRSTRISLDQYADLPAFTGRIRAADSAFPPATQRRMQLHQNRGARTGGHAYFASHPYLSYQLSKSSYRHLLRHQSRTFRKSPRHPHLPGGLIPFTYPLYLRDYLRPCFETRRLKPWIGPAPLTIVESTVNTSCGCACSSRTLSSCIMAARHGSRLRKDFH